MAIWDKLWARLLLSLVCFFRWMRCLYCLEGFELFGPRMLSIKVGVSSMWPFLAVVAFPLTGFVHAYYATGIWQDDLLRSFDIIYRLGFIGEHDMLELENI